MPDRVPRPPVRVRGGVPDGLQLNGLGDVAKHFLRAEPAPKFALVELGRRQLIHDDDQGSDVAVLEIRAIEVPGEAGQLELERMILAHRDQRTAAGTLPFDEEYSSNDADRALDLAHRIQVWADLNSKTARAEWEAFFGPYGDGVPTGPRGGTLEHLLQFCEHHEIPTRDDQPAADDAEDSGRPGVWHHGGSYGPETGDEPDDQADGDDQTEEDDDVPADEPDPAFSDR